MKFGLSDQVIHQIINLLKKYPSIDKAVIYGSRAKGNYHEGSDIDLCLYGKEINQSLLFQIDIALEELMLPYTFDLSNYESLKNKDLLSHIDRCGLLLFSSSS